MADLKTVREKILRHPDDFSKAFLPWMTIFNLTVYNHFENLTQKVWDAGFRRYSARTILGYMRFETNVCEQSDSPWKLNNNFTADFARLYIMLHPEQAELFETRKRNLA